MLNARQHREPEAMVLNDSHPKPPALFGKPWFWQRGSSDLEGTRGLARVILEMREEIRKLEAHDRMLPKDGEKVSDQEREPRREIFGEDERGKPCGNLRKNASAPILKGQFDQSKDNVVMTVRRYPMNSSPPEAPRNQQLAHFGVRLSHFGWGRIQEAVRTPNDQLDPSATSNVVPLNSQESIQEYFYKTRPKVKTVSFLLPVDDIYTNKPVLAESHEVLIGSPQPKSGHASSKGAHPDT